MSTGLMATICVFALVVLFGLVILLDRRKIGKEEAVPKSGAEVKMSPKERWDSHVEKLQKPGS
jgi:hypothetical protein